MKPITVEELSAYLDRELPPAARRDLEQRLERSPESRARLEELRAVVEGLRGLDRPPLPEELRSRVARQIRLDDPDRGLAGKLEERRNRYLGSTTAVWSLLAVILALAAIVFLVSHAMSRTKAPPADGEPQIIPVVTPSPADEP